LNIDVPFLCTSKVSCPTVPLTARVPSTSTNLAVLIVNLSLLSDRLLVPSAKNSNVSSSEPGDTSVNMKVSWSTSRTPPSDT